MMIRASAERGTTQLSWLHCRHSFAFGSYQETEWRNFGPLLALNEVHLAPGAKFPLHAHKNVDILTYPLAGQLSHLDTLTGSSILTKGTVQLLKAGIGVEHTEGNASAYDTLQYLQVWLAPSESNSTPAYKKMHLEESVNRFQLQPFLISDKTKLFIGIFLKQFSTTYWIEGSGWLQLISGNIQINGQVVKAGDGLVIKSAMQLNLVSQDAAEFLLFEFSR